MFFKKKLLPKSFFKTYEVELFKSSCEVIDSFVNSELNKDVYAFAFDGDSEYCDVFITVNTESKYIENINKTYSNYPEERLNGIEGVRYNSGDFSIRFENLGSKISKLTQDFYDATINVNDDRYDNEIQGYIATFELILVRVINKLAPSISKMDCTEDFISYISLHDFDYEKKLHYMRQSISEEKLNNVFPELLAYEKYLEQIQSLSVGEQFDHWISIYKSFLVEEESRNIRKMKSYRRNKFDVRDELVKLGSQVSSKLVDLICEYGRVQECLFCWIIPFKERLQLFKDLTAEERKKNNNTAIEAELTRDFLFMLKDIGYINENSEKKLFDLFDILYQENKLNKQWGLNITILARVLHSLKPNKYPKPDISDSGNEIMNIGSFNLPMKSN